MTTLSDPTLGLLIQVGAKKLTASHIKTLMMDADIFRYGYRDDNKDELLRSRLVGARQAAEDGDAEAWRALLRFVPALVGLIARNSLSKNEWIDEFRERLRADGLELTVVVRRDPGQSQRAYSLLPTDPTPVALSREITALEAELAARGYADALNHYEQAVDGLVNRKYESANGDLRTAFEDLVTRLAEDHAGYKRKLFHKTGQPSANQGGAAVKHLVEGGYLPETEGGQLLQGLWAMTHTNGSHPGQSDAGEARFRMQVITGVARFLLKHFSLTR